jgi:hypothetical protein
VQDKLPTLHLASPAFLSRGGEMGARMRGFDWRTTTLGDPAGWPQSLQSVLSISLNSPIVSAIYWGDEFNVLYNDAYTPALATGAAIENRADAEGREA